MIFILFIIIKIATYMAVGSALSRRWKLYLWVVVGEHFVHEINIVIINDYINFPMLKFYPLWPAV